MDRRTFLSTTATVIAAAGLAQRVALATEPDTRLRLKAPDTGSIRVAIALADQATVIDFCGPWEVFQDVMIPARGDSHAMQMPFELYTVAQSKEPIRASSGLHIIPDFSINDAPAPNVIVVPAMHAGDALRDWIKAASDKTDLTMSVCTGAFQLAATGLLDGLTATTHHDFYDDLAERFPKVTLVRNQRYVEHERVATAGGLTSGIDLALRVVQRYFGTDVAAHTAEYMEHASTRWQSPA